MRRAAVALGPVRSRPAASMAIDAVRGGALAGLASRLKQMHGGKIAVLVDLSAIPAIHNRIMFRSFARFIEERVLDQSIEAVSLARNILILLATPEMAKRLRGQLELLSSRLEDQRHGSIRVQLFDLDSQAKSFAETSQRLIDQAPAPRAERAVAIREEAAPDVETLGHSIELQRSLWQADLASLTRQQAIWTLAADTAPVRLADEAWVSISALERAVRIELRDNLWLFGKATEMLDQRMIAQLAADSRSLRRPLFVNLHLATIVGAPFQRLVEGKPATDIANLTVEVQLLEWRVNASLTEQAQRILRRHGIRLTLDGVRAQDIAGLTAAEWSAADYVKMDAAPGGLNALNAALQKLPAERRGEMAQKGILCHCESADAIAAGLAMKIMYYQGRGLIPFLEDADSVRRLLGATAADGAPLALRAP